MNKMIGADLFVKALENEGVKYVFGLPGEENIDFINSLKKSYIRFITTRHEQGAGFMAATYGRITNTPGVCLSTLGPGATNMITPIAYAQLGAMPLVVITGQKPINSSKQGRFQKIDIINMMEPVTKQSKQITSAKTIAASVRDAFRVAAEERPGSVHLELPEDIATESTSNTKLFPIHPIRRPDADLVSIQEAASMIYNSKKPLLLIGAGANRKRIFQQLKKFIDKTNIPFFTTQMGKGVISEEHPNYIGTAALSKNDYLHEMIESADTIINVGHDIVEKPPFFMKKDEIQKVIHINFNSADVDDVYFPQLEVIGDIGTSVENITKIIKYNYEQDFDYFFKLRDEKEEELFANDHSNKFPILPQRLVADVRKTLRRDGILALDNGTYKIWFC